MGCGVIVGDPAMLIFHAIVHKTLSVEVALPKGHEALLNGVLFIYICGLTKVLFCDGEFR